MSERHPVGFVDREDVLVAAHAALASLVFLLMLWGVVTLAVLRSSHADLAPMLVPVPMFVLARLVLAVVPSVRRIYAATGVTPWANLVRLVGQAKAWWRSHE